MENAAPNAAPSAKRGVKRTSSELGSLTVEEYYREQCTAVVQQLSDHTAELALRLRRQFEQQKAELLREATAEAELAQRTERDVAAAAASNAPTGIELDVTE